MSVPILEAKALSLFTKPILVPFEMIIVGLTIQFSFPFISECSARLDRLRSSS